MKKSDLKPLYVVKLRSGLMKIIIPLTGEGSYPEGTLAVYTPGQSGCQQMYDAYTDDLRSAIMPSSDVMEVYGYSRYSTTSLTTDCTVRKLLWKREEPKKLTLDEIEALLGFKIEIVEGE